jgi:hypothetical protein
MRKLEEVYLSRGRDALVKQIAAKLKGGKRARPHDIEEFQKRVDILDQEAKNVIAAIRKRGSPDLSDELERIDKDRELARNDLERAQASIHPHAPHRAAGAIVDGLERLFQRLASKDPAVQRLALRQFVAKIECRFAPNSPGKRRKHVVVEGKVFLREDDLLKLVPPESSVLTFCDVDLMATLPRKRLGPVSGADKPRPAADRPNAWPPRRGASPTGTR